MRLEGLTVSVGCADLLAATLPFSKYIFDRFLVVTDTGDTATANVCDFYEVEHIKTDAFTENDQVFNKGAGINEGLKHLDFSDWAIHIDADIALPPTAHHRLRTMSLDKRCIYGVDRLMVETYESWSHFLANPVRQSYNGSVWPTPFRMGYRYLYDFKYLPIGYFQMFNRDAKAFYKHEDFYPRDYDTAANSDSVFGQRWEPEYRKLIPELFVYHLEVEPNVAIGANWAGRTTKIFGPH